MELTSQTAGIVPIVMGLVSTLKYCGLPTQYAPIVSLVLGVALCMLVMPVSSPAILQGLVVGLLASGLYSTVKTTVQA
jgi:hypothetical protein